MKLTKHWHYLVLLLVILFSASIPQLFVGQTQFILSAMWGGAFFVSLIAWIVFAINKAVANSKKK